MDLIRLLIYFEIIGVIAFSISGALTGINKRLDLFGVIFLSLTTAVGGGILRDVLIGIIPPTAFVSPISATISIMTGLFVFYFHDKLTKFNKIIVVSDAIGLSVFAVIGCRTAVVNGANNAFIAVAMGLSTGCGGGILRDVFVNNIPFVLKKEIYAIAAIIGALSFYFINQVLSDVVALYLCAGITFLIRILAIKFDLSLPGGKSIET